MPNNERPRIRLTTYHDGDSVAVDSFADLDVIKIGKLPSSHLILESGDVARMHAVIDVTGSGVWIIDLGSLAGTMLNGDAVNSGGGGGRALSQGDVLEFGTHFRVEVTAIEYEQPRPAPIPRATPQTDLDQSIRLKHWAKYNDALGEADAWETPWHVTEAVHGETVADRVWGPESDMGLPAPPKTQTGSVTVSEALKMWGRWVGKRARFTTGTGLDLGEMLVTGAGLHDGEPALFTDSDEFWAITNGVWTIENAAQVDPTDAQPLRLTPTEAEDWRAMRMALLTAGMGPDYITAVLESATLDLRARVAADPPRSDQALEEALVHVLGLASVSPTNDILAEVGRLFRFWSEHNPTEII